MRLLVQWIREHWMMASLIILMTILVLSFIPITSLAQHDKALHFSAYFALVLPLMLKQPKYWFVILLGYALLSGAIEILQPYAHHRYDIMDILANTLGLLSGAIAAFIINCFIFPKNKR